MVTIQTINVGQAPNDKKGDPLRDAMQKVNLNTSALNDAIQGVLDSKGQPSGYASLGTDGRLLAAQAPIVYSAALPTTTHDLNNYVTPGTFYQAFTAGATSPVGLNYPVAVVGFLEVVATGTPVLQVYTTRTAGSTSQQFWRVRMSSTTWSTWKEIADTATTLTYQGVMAAGQDLNNYLQRGMWIIGSSATAAGGTNFPIGQSGSLFVYSAGHPGGTEATSCTQVYNAANTNRQFFRSLVSGVWSAWEEVVRSSLLGAANGVGSLDASGRQPVTQAPYSAILPAGTDANSLAAPGVWHINSDAQATAALNWPVVLAGTLNVEAVASGNAQVTQVYTTRNGTGGVIRRFVRVRFGASGGTWGTWQEIARAADLATVSTAVSAVSTAVAAARAVCQRGPGSGSWTTTVPQFYIDACAGGGGGGGGAGFVGELFRLNGAGGGAGEPMLGELITAPVGTVVSWTVGSGGTGGNGGAVSGAGVNGSGGGATVITINTSPVRTITLNAGNGGFGGASGGPALGGGGYPAGSGAFGGGTPTQSTWPQSGAGASSPFGGGGGGVSSLGGPLNGLPGGGYGSGGGGGACPSGAGQTGGRGGDGRGGFLKIYW
ncbi:pyocin knob domain-containing protein [Achromobacter animicus]|uniref:pyocin knob domain-containing protein n=1 Tax=Achromobacter animicus TaxID=1389935 RepID=UPI00146745C4|nr:pyocin knob domain-containing protein [Achromobacter animicus]CAB3850664.1 hypothetical protein LMG26691_01966 [Achromobacter animicus]